jgi:hypothetical protein
MGRVMKAVGGVGLLTASLTCTLAGPNAAAQQAQRDRLDPCLEIIEQTYKYVDPHAPDKATLGPPSKMLPVKGRGPGGRAGYAFPYGKKATVQQVAAKGIIATALADVATGDPHDSTKYEYILYSKILKPDGSVNGSVQFACEGPVKNTVTSAPGAVVVGILKEKNAMVGIYKCELFLFASTPEANSAPVLLDHKTDSFEVTK